MNCSMLAAAITYRTPRRPRLRVNRPWPLVAILVASAELGAQGVSVTGSVRNEAGQPVPEALVVVDPDSLSLRARAGVDGRYRVANVPAGRFEVRVVRIGFQPQSRTIEVGGTDITVDFVMQGVPLPLDTVAVRVARSGLYGTVATRGIALLPHAPRPLGGASVEVINGPHRTRTARDGTFSLPELGEGSHMVMVTLERYASRMVPVTIGLEGGVSVDIVLDSSYAGYQEWDEAQNRGIAMRMRQATSPAAFISPHELDLDAGDLRAGLRYAPTLLSKGVVVWTTCGSGAASSAGSNTCYCVFVNGRHRTEIHLNDLDPRDVEGIEVYPEGTVPTLDGLTPPQIGGPCEGLRAHFPGLASPRSTEPSPGRPLRAGSVLLIWTRGRR